MVNFRNCYSDEEIINCFKTIKKNNEKLLLWQTHVCPRLKCEVRIEHIITQTGTIVFSPLHATDDMFDFVSKHSLFVKANYKDLLFKVARKTWNEGVDKISIRIPDAIKVIELRKNERKIVKENQFFTMKVIKKINRGSQSIHNNFTMQILDISSGGACVLISKANSSFFKKGEKLQVVDMGEMNIFDHLESEIAYVTEANVTGFYRMGIQFKRKIANTELSQMSI